VSASKYDKYFIRGPKPGESNPVHLRYTAALDDDVIKGSFFFNATFMSPKYSTGIHGPHTHPYSEVLLFQGTDPDNPYELGWDLEIHMGREFELHDVTRTSLIYIPPKFVHCPIISRMKKPVFHVYCMNGPLLIRDDYLGTINQDGAFKRQYDKYFLSGPKPGETRERYKNFTTCLDGDVIQGSMHFASALTTDESLYEEQEPHSHPHGVVMGFFANNPDDVFDLGAEIEIRIGDELEKHSFNQSTLVYIPPGLLHCQTKCKINKPFIFVECSYGPKLKE
jgi:hypothetical protein